MMNSHQHFDDNHQEMDEKNQITEVDFSFDDYDFKPSNTFSTSSKFPGISNDAIYETRSRKKRAFTKEDDLKLKKAVQEYGENDWSLIASIVGNRTRRQCRERWKKFLCPTLNHSSWTEEEDYLLLSKYQSLGPKWSVISSSFKNRTDISVKTRFITLNRRMKKEYDLTKRILRNNSFNYQNDAERTNFEQKNKSKVKMKEENYIQDNSNVCTSPLKINHDDSSNTIDSFLDFSLFENSGENEVD